LRHLPSVLVPFDFVLTFNLFLALLILSYSIFKFLDLFVRFIDMEWHFLSCLFCFRCRKGSSKNRCWFFLLRRYFAKGDEVVWRKRSSAWSWEVVNLFESRRTVFSSFYQLLLIFKQLKSSMSHIFH